MIIRNYDNNNPKIIEEINYIDPIEIEQDQNKNKDKWNIKKRNIYNSIDRETKKTFEKNNQNSINPN